MKTKLLNMLHKADSGLYKIEAFMLVLCTLLLLILGFLPIVLRSVFDRSLVWAPELSRLLVLWITFFGASLAIRENKHISLEVLTQFLPQSIARYTKALVCLFVVLVCARFTYIGYHYYIFETFNINMGDFLFGTLAKTYFKVIYPLGFGLFTFHFTVKLTDSVKDIMTQ